MRIGLGLGLTRLGGGFNPASLFGVSDIGWVEPMIPGVTLFQDAAGTTPVTAPGQPVGLSLDKSKPIGPELIVNGDFAASTGWTLGTGWSIGGGVATRTNTGTATNITRLATMTAGRTYRITFTITAVTSGSIAPILLAGGGNSVGTYRTAPGTYTEYLVAAATPSALGLAAGAAFAGSVDNISVKEIPGNHFVQPTALNRPIYQVDAQGRGYLSHNGSNQWMSTAAFAWGSDKATIVAGVRKLSDAARGVIVELGANADTTDGGFLLTGPNGASLANFAAHSRGTALSVAGLGTANASPVTRVISMIAEISTDTLVARQNGAQVASVTTDQGTGNFGTYPLYRGARAGSTLFFNGNIYPNMGINRLLTAGELAQVEAWVNSKTGAY